jgi:hypothetical protein
MLKDNRTDIAKYAASIFLLSCSVGCMGTSIALLRTDSEVVVSTDSLALDEGGARSTVCKISPSGSGFFALASSVADYGGTGIATFDATKIARQVGKEKTLKERADTFRRIALPGFRNAVEDMRNNLPSKFKEVVSQPWPLQAIFVGVEGGVAAYQVEVFAVTLAKGKVVVTPERIACPAACKVGFLDTRLLGENEAAKPAARPIQGGGVLDPNNLLDSSRKLVGFEERYAPGNFGGPIVSVTVQVSKPVVWTDPSHVCAP